MMAKVYRSKLDPWLVAVLLLAVGLASYGIVEILAIRSTAAWATAAFIFVIGVALPIWILVSTRYTLDQRRLSIRSGPFKWLIPLADITAITATSSPLSSPALSLDRLRIDYGQRRSIMISPRDKQRFLREIETAPSQVS